MSALLDDIINLAIDGKQPLPDILRKCLLLGHELKNERLKTWANQELNGYKSKKELPEYRVVKALAYGDFIGPFHAQYRNHIIPPAALEEKHRHYAEMANLVQSVSALAGLADTDPSKGNLICPWPPNMVAYYQEKLMSDCICHNAWQEIPNNVLVQSLDTVRNITLRMALEIKDELGTSYTDLRRIESNETATKIQSIILLNTGGNVNMAFGQASVDASRQGQTIIAAGDRKALDAILSKAGLGDADLDSLSEAIEIDGKKPGNKVGEWVKEKASKVLSGGVKVGTDIGAQILTAWIKQHYGL